MADTNSASNNSQDCCFSQNELAEIGEKQTKTNKTAFNNHNNNNMFTQKRSINHTLSDPSSSSSSEPPTKLSKLSPKTTIDDENNEQEINENNNNNNNNNNQNNKKEKKKLHAYGVLNRPNYTGHTLLSKSGEILAKIPEKRFHWYLRKQLATQVDSLTIQLNFEAKGQGNAGDPYYLSEHINQCVVCGDDRHYTRHHVVPHEYRKWFPLELKSSNSHDIVLLCCECHERYENEAMRLKKHICERYGVEINGSGKVRDGAVVRAKSSVNALMNHGHVIPEQRRKELHRGLNQFLVDRGLLSLPLSLMKSGGENGNNDVKTQEMEMEMERILTQGVSVEMMQAVLLMDEWHGLDQYVPHGQGVVNVLLQGVSSHEDRVKRLDEFAITWRQHFVDIMSPRFINPHWSITRSMQRN